MYIARHNEYEPEMVTNGTKCGCLLNFHYKWNEWAKMIWILHDIQTENPLQKWHLRGKCWFMSFTRSTIWHENKERLIYREKTSRTANIMSCIDFSRFFSQTVVFFFLKYFRHLSNNKVMNSLQILEMFYQIDWAIFDLWTNFFWKSQLKPEVLVLMSLKCDHFMLELSQSALDYRKLSKNHNRTIFTALFQQFSIENNWFYLFFILWLFCSDRFFINVIYVCIFLLLARTYEWQQSTEQ